MASVDKEKKVSLEEHFNVALRQRTINLEGALKGYYAIMRPPTGYESVRTSEIAENRSFADAVVWLLSQITADWNLMDSAGVKIPITEETFRNISMPALRSLRRASDQIVPEFDEETAPLSEGSSQKLDPETQETENSSSKLVPS